VLAVVAMALVSSCFTSEDSRQAGVISTENAGRVAGSIVRSDGSALGELAEIRLLRLSDSTTAAGRTETANRTSEAATVPVLVARIEADSNGSYQFPEVEPGTYRVDAILPSGLRGSSGAFAVASDSTVRLVVVVVVVPSFQFALIPSAGDSILSVWVGDQGRLATNSGVLWTMPVVPDVADAVGVVVRRASGAIDTVMYRLSWVGSVARLDPVSTAETSPSIGSVSTSHFGTDTATVAHWTFDTLVGGTAQDVSGNGRNLSATGIGSLRASPFGNAATTGTGYFQRAFDSALTPQVSGTVLYEARVYLEGYPSSSLHNGRAVVMGFYEGPKLVVTDSGSIQIGGQRGDGTSWIWAGGESKAGTVPLGRWVDLAVACERATGAVWAWVDGERVELLRTSVNPGQWRIATTVFMVGKDSQDGQAFAGRIDEIRVSRRIPATLLR
jgi:hypothetical protein